MAAGKRRSGGFAAVINERHEGKPADLAAILQAITLRDHQDRTRSIAPMKPAEGAVVVDTTHVTENEALEKVLHVVCGQR